MKPRVILINGCPASGKSSLAKLLSQELPEALTAHVEIDVIYNMIKRGWTHPCTIAGKKLLDYAFKQSIQIINFYLDHGITVVCDYVWSAEQINQFSEKISSKNIHMMHLTLPLVDLLDRDQNRCEQTQVGIDTITDLYHSMEEERNRLNKRFVVDAKTILTRDILDALGNGVFQYE